jgi:hypothetical protein
LTLALASSRIQFDLYCRGDEALNSGPAKARALAAKGAYDRWAAEYFAGRLGAWDGYIWSRRWMEAEIYLNPNQNGKVQAAEEHLARMKSIEKSIMERIGKGRAGSDSYLAAEYFRTDAEFLLFQARAKPEEKEAQDVPSTPLASAVLIYDSLWLDLHEKRRIHQFRSALVWSHLWFEADISIRKNKADRLAAAEAYVNRTKEIEKLAKVLLDDGKLPIQDFWEATLNRADAEILLSNIKGVDHNQVGSRSNISKVQLDAAKSAFAAEWKDFLAGRGNHEKSFVYSTAWLRAASALTTTKAERIAAYEAHLARMKQVQKPIATWYQAGRVPIRDLLAANFFLADAELQLSQTKTKD